MKLYYRTQYIFRSWYTADQLERNVRYTTPADSFDPVINNSIMIKIESTAKNNWCKMAIETFLIFIHFKMILGV